MWPIIVNKHRYPDYDAKMFFVACTGRAGLALVYLCLPFHLLLRHQLLGYIGAPV